MGTTFSDLYDDIITKCGLRSSTADESLVKSYINDRYKAIVEAYPWPWMYEKTTLLTTAKYDTGTVTTNGTTTITGSGTTFTSSMVGRKFKVTGFEEIYTISAFVSTTEITLDNDYNGDDTSSASYEIFQDLVSLPSTLDSIVCLRQHRTPIELTPIGIRELFDVDPSPTPSDLDPQKYAYYKLDSSSNQQIILYPPPYRQIVLDLEYKKLFTELSSDSDEPVIPEQYRSILKFGPMSDIYLQKRDDTKDNRWAIYEDKYNSILKNMLSKCKNTDDYLRLIPNVRRATSQNLDSLINQGYDLGEYFDLA